tara:strand:- start:1188 stop:1811 length:624 start_codon:yes stop_codon:yes gene_type:complete
MRFVDVNVDEVAIGDYNNRKMSLRMSETDKPVKFQIPRMYMPFGVSGFTPEAGATKWNIDFSMKGWDEEGNYVNKFYTFVKKIEDSIIDKVFAQSNEIFNRQVPRKELERMFNSNIKELSDRDPKLRTKVNVTYDGEMRTTVFDVDNENITKPPERGLYSQHSGTAQVELAGVYFMNKMFGVTWKISQLTVFEPQRLNGFQFILDES